MRIVVSRDTPLPLPQVWAWWIDFGKAGEELKVTHGVGTSRRRILRSDPDLVVFEERLPALVGQGLRAYLEEVHVFRDAHRLEVKGEGRPPWDATWTFETSASGGTRITRDTRIHGRALDLTGMVGEWAARRLLQADVDHHVRQMEKDLAG